MQVKKNNEPQASHVGKQGATGSKKRIYLESLGPAAEIDSKVQLILSLRKRTKPSGVPHPEALNSCLLDNWLNRLGGGGGLTWTGEE